MSTPAPAALKESHEKAEKEEPQKVEPSHLPVGGTTNVPDPDATTVLYPQPVNSGDGEKSADAVQPPPPKVPEPNSSTHRAAHARLVRRMSIVSTHEQIVGRQSPGEGEVCFQSSFLGAG